MILKMRRSSVPKEKLLDVQDFLAGKKSIGGGFTMSTNGTVIKPSPEDDPWSDLLEEDND